MTIIYGTGVPNAQTDFNQFKPTNPSINGLAMDCKTIDPFFDTTNYIGAFDPSGTTWLTTPWISLELQ